jgi:hypothetical protein
MYLPTTAEFLYGMHLPGEGKDIGIQ